MAQTKTRKTLAQQIAELQDTTPRDFDPEDAGLYQEPSEGPVGSASDDDDDGAGREHYEEVGKSKLRKQPEVQLGAAYRGARISRDAIDSSDENDPFAQDFATSDEEEVGSQSELNEDAEHVENEADGLNGYSDDDDAISDDLDTDDSGDSEQGAINGRSESNGLDDINEIRRLVVADQKSVASALSQAVKTDIEKGQAIRAQRSAFDAVLNLRIKLQPGLVATNSMLAASSLEKDKAASAIAGAEKAARRLWSTIGSLQDSLFEARTGQKRKQPLDLEAQPLSAMWSSMQEYEKSMKRQRTANLDTWASKTRATMNVGQGRRLNDTIQQQTLSDVLNGQLSDMSRLVAKTSVPRSCAPVQAAASKGRTSTTDTGIADQMVIYDDADFYGPLLQTLVAQRSSDAAALSAMNVSFASQPWQAMREAKTKKMVDTKASKGRKLRYTVHEKLQNIMASENRAMWSDRQCDELFASLQGRRVALEEGASDDEQDIAEQSLRLFAS